MLSVKFYLHTKGNAKGYHPLNIIVHADGHFRPPLRMAIGEKVKPEYWNHDKQVVKAKGLNAIEINARLERIYTKVSARFREMLDSGAVPTKYDLGEMVAPAKAAKMKVAKAPETPREVWNAWGAWYLQEKNVGNTNEKQKGEAYVRRGQQVVGWLEKFDPGLKVKDLLTRTPEYRLWLLSNTTTVQDATIKKHIDLIRSWLKYLGLPFNRVATLKEPKSVKAALSWKEVLHLYHAEYLDINHRHAVDAFVANCQVGLRWEDLLKPSAGSLLTMHAGPHGDVLTVNLNQGKTGDQHFVPVPPLARGILERHGWRFPVASLEAKDKRGYLVKPKTDQARLTNYNVLLKEAGQIAGLDRKIRKVKVRNGHITEEYKPVSEVMSSHLARHTGYTLVKVATKSKDLAEAQLGHANDSPYLHNSPEVLVEELLDAWIKIEKG